MVKGELSLHHDLIPCNDTFVIIVSFLKLYSPVKKHFSFKDVITLESRAVVDYMKEGDIYHMTYETWIFFIT